MAKPRHTLKDVVLHYVHANTPTLQYKKKAVPDQPLANKEYIVDACISATEIKRLKKKYKGQGVKSLKEAKEYTAEEYLKAFKVKAPNGYDDDEGNFFILKFRAFVKFPSGDICPTPQVVGIVGKTKDRAGNVIRQDTSIGNGSGAFLQYEERTYSFEGTPGIALDLKGIAITSWIEFVAEEMDWEFEEDENPEADPFGDDEAAGNANESQPNEQAGDPGIDEEWADS